MTIDTFSHRVEGPCASPSDGVQAVRVCTAHDADEQARNLVDWRQTYDQLMPGPFTGTLTELPLDRMQVFCETTSHTLRQTCEVPADAYWFGIPGAGHSAAGASAARDSTARIDANPITPDALAVRPGGIEFELVTPEQFAIYGVVVKRDVLRRCASEVERIDLDEPLLALAQRAVIAIGAAHIEPFRAALGHVLDGARASQAPLAHVAGDSLQAWVLASLFDLCSQSRESQASRGEAALPAKPRRQWIVSQARDYVLANRARPVGVPELCAQLHVSRRTLQYCFQDVLGMAPATFLRTIRLNGARRDLCSGSSSDARTVQDVAAAWGFWHLSQFATDYKKLFGKRPSDSLRERRAA
ncbi:helix-turn-helix domain-containing protein [Trinickia violacea]|uniref:Helix-turn-helix domain-containing protein n=1 Tax=Trinickia violacea TaxID=2571746 RepID=A0A4P8IIY3_9BURK|nr:helix-turn-helix domain-containing protein [Trinickia violacea]QCP47721.1 helix-turn-helix domain-containing protein [Trinickia violacea]